MFTISFGSHFIFLAGGGLILSSQRDVLAQFDNAFDEIVVADVPELLDEFIDASDVLIVVIELDVPDIDEMDWVANDEVAVDFVDKLVELFVEDSCCC